MMGSGVSRRSFLLAAGLLACTPRPAAEPVECPLRVLVLTATAGFRHESIPVARQTLTDLAVTNGFQVTLTEDPQAISADVLTNVDVLFFCLTSGELAFDDSQKAAILAFVQAGGGFIGVHSATDTCYQWPEYGSLTNARFKEHPWVQPGDVIVEDKTFPGTAGLGDRFRITEEFYTFQQNPRPNVNVVLRLDAASVGATGDYPLGWWQNVGKGRTYYNALGHFDEMWRDNRFRDQLVGAIRWAAEGSPIRACRRTYLPAAPQRAMASR